MKLNIFKIIVLLSAFLIINTVKAEENKIMSKLSETQKINGKSYNINAGTKDKVQRYLVRHILSTSDTDIIVDDIDEIIEVYKAKSTPNWNELEEDDQTKITNIVADMNTRTNIKIDIDSEGIISIYEPNGELFTKLDQAFDELPEEKKEIPNEGNKSSNTAIIVGGAAFLVLVLVTSNVISRRP
jgi:hypothetical protein